MIGLPRNIIQKYGVTKKAWAVYRAQKGGSTIRTKTQKREVTHVAKNRHFSKKSGVSPQGLLIPAMVYGALRQKISLALTPITSKVPLGDIADEVVLAGASYLIVKKVKNKMVRDVARAAFTIEVARIGEALVNGSVFGGSTNTSSGVQVI